MEMMQEEQRHTKRLTLAIVPMLQDTEVLRQRTGQSKAYPGR